MLTWEQLMEEVKHSPDLHDDKLDLILDIIQEWDHEGVCELFNELFTNHPRLLDIIYINRDDGSIIVIPPKEYL